MEFWEGAILLVGGIWLVGRVHRNTMKNATVMGAAPVVLPFQKVPGPTSETNQDGSGYLVSGETLHSPATLPVATAPCTNCGPKLNPPGIPVNQPMFPTLAPVALPRPVSPTAVRIVQQPSAAQLRLHGGYTAL